MSNTRKLSALLLSSTMLMALPVMAQTTQDKTGSDGELIVTAQKRSERLQSVPISIQAIGTKKLDQLNIASFTDYAALLPSVSFQTAQPGQTNVYIRGVASGGDGNHSGPLPSVGVYLDEQPVTTIGGALDVHIYDIARIESLAGPQGTLYGASSEAGTLRIITNKPDTKSFYGRFDIGVNKVSKGGTGNKLEGMLNIPLSDKAALRLVGWSQKDAGYIDNVAGTRTFIGGITANNAAFVGKDVNEVETTGARAALKIDLNDNWTVSGTVLAQDQKSKGAFGTDARVGDLQHQHFFDDNRHDRFVQAALTLQGKIGNFDLTYAGAHLDRKIDATADYTDYAEQYDILYSAAGGIAGYFYFTNTAGAVIDPRQKIIGQDKMFKDSHEFRIASPSSDSVRFVAGLFSQTQTHFIFQDYQVPNLSANMSVNGRPGTLWLTQQKRVDRDRAIFGEVSFDMTPKLTGTIGVRAYEYENSLIGFFGFGRNANSVPPYQVPPYNAAGSSRTGVAGCYTTTGDILRNNLTGTLMPAMVPGSPCTNLADFVGGKLIPKVAKGNGTTYKFNLSYKATPDILLYGTVSKGFRPGGINRRASIAPYAADDLSNIELGFKTTLADRTLRLNGAIYQQDWAKFQFAFLGANSFTEVHNGPDARIQGLELDMNWQPDSHWNIAGSASFTDAKTKKNLCLIDDPTFTCSTSGISAPKGTRLPITPQNKLSLSVRYAWEMDQAKPYVQALLSSQSSASSDIRTLSFYPTGVPFDPAAMLGKLPAYSKLDLAIGVDMNKWNAELFIDNVGDERGQISRYQECGSCTQRPYAVVITPMTLGVRVGSKF